MNRRRTIGAGAPRAAKAPIGWLACAVLLSGISPAALAQEGGFFAIGDTRGQARVTLDYAAAMRTGSPDRRLIDDTINPFTGLPVSINSDDGNRNFDSGSLINNRASALLELSLQRGDYGLMLRGDAFYDHVYRTDNDNDRPDTVNKDGDNDRFTSKARQRMGARARLLDAYVYGDWRLSETARLNLRLGRQVVAWGESLFFSGLAGAQGPADATRANVPAAELRSILLPVEQGVAQVSLGHDFSVMAYYRLRYRETELDPAGSFFSFADMIGPGADRLFVFADPATGQPVPFLRQRDDRPSHHGQWGVGLRYQLNATTNVDAYWVRFHNTLPQLRIDPATFSYRQVFFDDIDIWALSFSTSLWDASLAGEVNFRRDIDMLVDDAQGNPAASRGRATQALTSLLYTFKPNPISRQIDLVAEIGYLRAHGVDALADGSRRLSNDREAFGYTVQLTFRYPNVIPRWDLALPITVGGLEGGTPAVAGAFGSLIGEGDRRIGVGATATYLQGLEVGIRYNAFLGSADPVKRPLVDRDYIATTLKYNF